MVGVDLDWAYSVVTRVPTGLANFVTDLLAPGVVSVQFGLDLAVDGDASFPGRAVAIRFVSVDRRRTNPWLY